MTTHRRTLLGAAAAAPATLAFAAAPAGAQAADQLEANKRLVRTYVEEVTIKGNHAKLAELTTPDMVRHGVFPSEPEPGYFRAEGQAAVRDSYERHRQVRTVTQVQILDAVAEGDRVMLRLESTWLLQTPTGPKTVQMPVMSFWRIKDGKIAETHVLFDRAELNRQLGG
jgi:ketosteroid isomerase-like protein